MEHQRETLRKVQSALNDLENMQDIMVQFQKQYLREQIGTLIVNAINAHVRRPVRRPIPRPTVSKSPTSPCIPKVPPTAVTKPPKSPPTGVTRIPAVKKGKGKNSRRRMIVTDTETVAAVPPPAASQQEEAGGSVLQSALQQSVDGTQRVDRLNVYDDGDEFVPMLEVDAPPASDLSMPTMF